MSPQLAQTRKQHGWRWCALGLALVLGMTWEIRGDDPPKEEPPVRLKKKVRPNTEEKDQEKTKETEPKKEPGKIRLPEKVRIPGKSGKDDDPEDLPTPDKDPREIVARVAKNMRSVEDRLGKKDAGDHTRQVQRDIIKDLDALIEQTRQRQQQQQSSSSRSARNQRQKGSQDKQNQADIQTNPQSLSQENAGMEAGAGGRSKGGRSRIADLYKDIWGHLPETMRQEMDAYSREQFMAKYSDLLKQYYSAIAEKGRHKGDQ